MKSTFVIKHPLPCGVILDDLFTLTFIIPIVHLAGFILILQAFNTWFLVEEPQIVLLQLKNQGRKNKQKNAW